MQIWIGMIKKNSKMAPPLLTLFLSYTLSNLSYTVQSYMRNPWKNNQTNNITISSWQTVIWPCLDEQKGHVLQLCQINHLNLIKNLSLFFQALASSLVQHHQLTPPCATVDRWVWRPSQINCNNKIEKDALSATQPVRLWSIARNGSHVLLWHPSHALSTGYHSWQAWVCKEWRSTLHTCFGARHQSHLAQERTLSYTTAASAPHVNGQFRHWF